MVVCRTNRKILNKNQIDVLEIIAKCSQNGDVCSQKYILSHINLSKRTVFRILKYLTEQQWILKQQNKSTSHVCLTTTYLPNTERLSQCQNLTKNVTEYLSQCQPHNLTAIYNIYNIYNIFKNTPNSMLKYKGKEKFGVQKKGAFMISYQTTSTLQETTWDAGKIAFYKLLFQFYGRCNQVLALDLIKQETPHPEVILGVLTKEEENQTRSLFRDYAKSRNLNFTQFTERLLFLADYLAQRKPYQVKNQNMALSRLIFQQNLFSTLMTEANQFSETIQKKIEQTHQEEKEINKKYWAPKDEVLPIIEACKKQLGIL